MAIHDLAQIPRTGIIIQLKVIPIHIQVVKELRREITHQRLQIMGVAKQFIQDQEVVNITTVIVEEKCMCRNSKFLLLALLCLFLSANAYAQSARGNLEAMSGAMQGWMKGARDANDREQQVYEINMRTYQMNLNDYYRCLDYKLRFKRRHRHRYEL